MTLDIRASFAMISRARPLSHGEVDGQGLKKALNSTLGRVAAAARSVAACELALAPTIDFAKGRKTPRS